MNKKTVLEKIAELFTTPEADTTDVLEFIDVKTIDNRIMRVAELVVGAEVKEITEDGEVDVEDREYELEDGMVLKVEDGKIVEFYTPEEEEAEEVEAESEEEVEVEMSEEIEEEFTEDDTQVEELVSNIKNLLDQVNSLQEQFNSLKEENEGLKLEVEKFAKAPSVEPTNTKLDFNKKSTKPKSYLHSYLENKK